MINIFNLISFCNSELLIISSLNLKFKKILKEIGIKERSIYNLRHTFASHMISNI
jgi:integrase